MIAYILHLATTYTPPPVRTVPDSSMTTSLLLGAAVLGLGLFARFIKNLRK